MTRPAAGRGFGVWLGAATASALGDSVTAFALAWAAAAHGAGAAGAVLTAEAVPLCALILAGGVAADRWGIRRVMIVCDVAMAAVMASFVIALQLGQPLWLLALAALLSGTAAALRRPAAGAFPRLFVRGAGPGLTRVTATVGLWLQAARIAGPAAAGVVIAVGGLTLTSTADALSFVVIALVLLRVRPPFEPVPRDGGIGACTLRDAVRSARCTPGVPGALVTVALLAGAVLPLMELCVPVAGRQRHWGAHVTGLVTASWVAGGIVVTAWVSRRGRVGPRLSVGGPLLAAAGVAAFAFSRSAWLGAAGIAAVGVGTPLLTARVLPRFVAASPPAMLARFQALLGLAQTGPVLVVTPVLGALAGGLGLVAALVTVVVLLVGTAVAAAFVERLTAAPGPAVQGPAGQGSPAGQRSSAVMAVATGSKPTLR